MTSGVTGGMTSGMTWPNGKKIAVSVTVMFENGGARFAAVIMIVPPPPPLPAFCTSPPLPPKAAGRFVCDFSVLIN